MAVIVEVTFAHEEGALAETLGEFPDLDVTVVRETSTEPRQSTYFLRIEYEDSDEIPRMLERDPTVREVTSLPEFDGQQLWGVEFAPETELLGPRVTSEGGFVIDARSENPGSQPRGWHERWLLPDREAVNDVWSHARAIGFDFDIRELREVGGTHADRPVADTLTDEQRAALRTAYERGYFTEPRETSLDELATELDLSPSAVGGRLKRGMKSLIGTTLVVDRREQ